MKPDALTWRPCLAASLSLTLAACGGGNTPAGPSADPATDTKAIQTKAVAPIAAEGIRGDVLAQALRTTTSRELSGGRRLMAKAHVWTDEPPAGTQDRQVVSPAIYLDQRIRDNTNSSGLEGSFIYSYTPIPRGVNESAGSPTIFSAWRIDIGSSARGPLDTPASSGDVEVLRLSPQLRLDYHLAADHAVNQLPHQRYTLTSAAPYSIRSNDSIGWQQTLHRWEGSGSSPHVVELHVRRGDNDRQFQLCLEVLQQQRGCTRWEIPADWSAGQALVYRGQTFYARDRYNNWAYWNTLPDSLYVDPDGRRTASKHASYDGVSGALLAATFDGWSARGRNMQALPAYAVHTPNHNQPVQQPPVGAFQSSRVRQYADGQDSGDSYSPARGTYLYTLRSGRVTNESGLPLSADQGFPAVTLALNLKQEVIDNQLVLTLPRWLGLRVQQRNASGAQETILLQEVHDAPETQILGHELVASEAWVKTWSALRNGDAHVSLWIPLVSESESGLCWEIRLPMMYRDICTYWTVPAGWAPGQHLPVSYYRVTDQADMRDESGWPIGWGPWTTWYAQ